MDKTEIIALAKTTARQYALDPALVCAVIEQESSWNPWAIRFEPDFMARYVNPLFLAGKISGTEAYARSFSWGLMQVMGEVAREQGYIGTSLAELCDPQTAIDQGCQRLAKAFKQVGDVPDVRTAALLHYNGGANPNYAEEVIARIPNYA